MHDYALAEHTHLGDLQVQLIVVREKRQSEVWAGRSALWSTVVNALYLQGDHPFRITVNAFQATRSTIPHVRHRKSRQIVTPRPYVRFEWSSPKLLYAHYAEDEEQLRQQLQHIKKHLEGLVTLDLL